jgi:hypothetical protein
MHIYAEIDYVGARATAYDTETHSMLQTPQRFPRAGSQSYPTPAATANADSSTTVTFSPERPADTPGGQLDPDDRGQGLVRAPAPLQPARPVLRQELAAERDRSREDNP